MTDINELRFDKNGLIPAIVVDSVTKRVLTLAYMNRESLRISMEKGLTCFWSRSRQTLWLKGETSGNFQHNCRLRPGRAGGKREAGRPCVSSGHRKLL